MRPGTIIDGAAFVGDGVEDGPKASDEVEVIDGSGVASDAAVPRTPARVASPPAAADDTDEILHRSGTGPYSLLLEVVTRLTLVDMSLER